jgi:hypothetical protein
MQIIDDTVYLVTKEYGLYSDADSILWNLSSMNLIQAEDSAKQEVQNEFSFDIHLDSYRLIKGNEMKFNLNAGTAGIGETTFDIPFGYHNKADLYAWTTTLGNYRGQIEVVTVRRKGKSNKMQGVLPGNRTQTEFFLGYNYKMEVELPTIYRTIQGEKVQADIRSGLTLHRCQFNFADVGTFDVEVKINGKQTYTHTFEQTEMDGYRANDVALEYSSSSEVPICASNLDTNITLISKLPTPATLVSMSWEGAYNTKFYKRV